MQEFCHIASLCSAYLWAAGCLRDKGRVATTCCLCMIGSVRSGAVRGVCRQLCNDAEFFVCQVFAMVRGDT